MYPRLSLVLSALILATACERTSSEPQAPAPAVVVVTPDAPVAVVAPVVEAPAPVEPAPADPVLALDHRCDGGASSHLEAGRMARSRKDLPAAIEAFRMALADEPGSVDAAAALALSASEENEVVLARAAYGVWSELDAVDPTPLLRHARLELGAGDDRAAAALIEAALERDAKSAEAFHLKGRIFFRQGRFAAAIAAFESAIELDPGHAFAFNNLGLSHLRLGNWKEAMESLTAATLLRPDVAFIHNNLGIAYEKLGYTTEALAEYRMAVVIDPSYVKGHVNLQRLSAVADVRYFVIERGGPSTLED